MIDLAPRFREQIKGILERHIPQRVIWVFGSRAQGKAKPFSDLDLAIEGQERLPLRVRRRLEDDFEQSRLPIRIDLVELCDVDPAFRVLIEKQRAPL